MLKKEKENLLKTFFPLNANHQIYEIYKGVELIYKGVELFNSWDFDEIGL